MTTTVSCPHCGAVLPQGLARVCLACYERVEGLPEGTPLGSPQFGPGLTSAQAAAACLLYAGLFVALKGALVSPAAAGGGAQLLLGAGAGMVVAGLLLLARLRRTSPPPSDQAAPTA